MEKEIFNLQKQIYFIWVSKNRFWKSSIIKKTYKNELIEIKKKFDKNLILIISSFVTSEKKKLKNLCVIMNTGTNSETTKQD